MSAGSRVAIGRVGLGLLTRALTGLDTLFLRFGSRFLTRSSSLEGLGTFALAIFAFRRILALGISDELVALCLGSHSQAMP